MDPKPWPSLYHKVLPYFVIYGPVSKCDIICNCGPVSMQVQVACNKGLVAHLIRKEGLQCESWSDRKKLTRYVQETRSKQFKIIELEYGKL